VGCTGRQVPPGASYMLCTAGPAVHLELQSCLHAGVDNTDQQILHALGQDQAQLRPIRIMLLGLNNQHVGLDPISHWL
jgi:hypothetical protein